MKVGILTHQYINNYGAFLQGYALCEAVSKLLPDAQVEIIDYVNIKHFVINVGGWFRFYKDRENFACWSQKIKLPTTFAHARKKDMKLSPLCLSTKGVNKQGYDVILVGSDEVWNYKDNKGNAKIKFGYGLECKNLIAYAPSVGKTSGNDNIPDYVKEGIAKFKAISARDDLTADLSEKITGKAPTRVLDPTFLAPFPKEKLKVPNKPYLLFYYCEHLPENIKHQIFEYAKQHDLAIYGAGECDKQYTSITVNLKPFEWVEMFRNAEFVFTGTFHGAVFSILNNKQFKVYLTNESRIKKVGALLNEFQIANREMNKDFKFDLEQMKDEIDYSKVNEIIETKRQTSLQYLKSSISE